MSKIRRCICAAVVCLISGMTAACGIQEDKKEDDGELSGNAQIRADEMITRYNMDNHVENGQYVEFHYENTKEGRADSGSIYYFVSPGERTEFHRIDCDEYWCYHAGETIELWVVNQEGKLTVKYLGLTEGAEPTIRIAAGEIFASRLPADASDGCFIACITVPRFSYDGFEMFEKDEMIRNYPQTESFWK